MTDVLFAIFIALSIADGVTTYLALKNPRAYEANKILAALMDKIGVVPTLILFKGIGLAAGVGIYLTREPLVPYVLGALILWYAWGVSKNVQVLRG